MFCPNCGEETDYLTLTSGWCMDCTKELRTVREKCPVCTSPYITSSRLLSVSEIDEIHCPNCGTDFTRIGRRCLWCDTPLGGKRRLFCTKKLCNKLQRKYTHLTTRREPTLTHAQALEEIMERTWYVAVARAKQQRLSA